MRHVSFIHKIDFQSFLKTFYQSIKNTFHKKMVALKKHSFFENKKRYFLITSHGQTATTWLAAAINKHPEIFCTHGYSHPFMSAEERELTAEERIKKKSIWAERFWKLSLNDFLNELEQASTQKVLGNVHAFTLGYLIKLLSELPKEKQKNLVIMNMVRHPIPRIMSMFKCWIHPTDENQIASFVDPDFKNRCKHIVNHISEKYNIQYSPRDKTFVVCLLAMEDITKDVVLARQKDIINISFEDLFENKKYLDKILNKITGKSIKINEMTRNEMYSTKKINSHNNQQESSIYEQYHQWQDWQKTAFNFIVESNNMRKIYSKFNYDFPC